MKKLTASVLLILWILTLFGCGFRSGDVKEPVEFYYPWADLETQLKQDPASTVIGSESREASGHTGDLDYLLSMYLRGPLDSQLSSPFPAGCKIVEIRPDGQTLRITLNSAFAQLEDLDLTLACACLARTCFGMTNAAQVRIEAAAPDDNSSVSITISRTDLLLEDDSTPTQEETTAQTQS